jgi:hypothetical protein
MHGPSRKATRGVWRLAFGVWRLAFGVWRLAFGVWRSAFAYCNRSRRRPRPRLGVFSASFRITDRLDARELAYSCRTPLVITSLIEDEDDYDFVLSEKFCLKIGPGLFQCRITSKAL